MIRISIFLWGRTKDCEGLQRAAGTMKGNRTSQQFFGGMGSSKGLKGPQETMGHRHMARGGHGLPKVLSGPAMPEPSMPCGRATPETA
jgi:hypothetical protein